MTERPILFSAPMVRALLDGSKTQTRRNLYVATKNGSSACFDQRYSMPRELPPVGNLWTLSQWRKAKPGDRLWVKETWRTAKSLDAKSPSAIGDMCIDAGYRTPWAPLAYEADGQQNTHWRNFELDRDAELGKTRVSIHMPRWASRITLEITGVRVERLQDISEADAVAEGLMFSASARRSPGCMGIYELRMPDGKTYFDDNACDLYRKLWEQINGPGSWDANPWVWVVEFRRIK